MLEINNIEVKYAKIALVLKGVSIKLEEKQIGALLGANGAGKTTTLKSVSGLLKSQEGQITRGVITFNGEVLNDMNPDKIVRMGIVQVLEGRPILQQLNVKENILVGANVRNDRGGIKKDLEEGFGYFPKLRDLRNTVCGYLSGGEQQMVVMLSALMAKPKVMLLDEPSLGLAPLLVNEIYEIVRRINEEQGTSILLVEQNAKKALSAADYVYIMENGKIVMDGEPEKIGENEDVKEFYLGLSEIGSRKSYRDIKHYRRRKRWLT
jgi:branched-chain amino acid transport system ATP-binding protein